MPRRPPPPDTAFDDDEIEAYSDLLDKINANSEESLSPEYVDGFVTALICAPRLVMPSEYFPVLFGEQGLDVFSDKDEANRFFSLFQRRWNQIAVALDAPVEDLSDPQALAPLIMDWDALIAELPAEERTLIETEGLPLFGSLWANGFLEVVDHWHADWALPAGSKDEIFVDEMLEPFSMLASAPEDLTAEERAASREEYIAMAIWSAYELRDFWRDRGSSTQQPLRKAAEPGRNETCPCGSGKKFKKCCGAADKLH